jgi:hypothetical protein
MEIAGLDGIRSCGTMFFLTIWFQSERGEALQVVATGGHVLFHGEVNSGEWHEIRDD